MSSLTARFYANDTRISTAVYTRNGIFLQVYPTKQTFKSADEWRDFWQKSSNVLTYVKITPSPPPKERTVKEKKPKKVNSKDWVMRTTTKFTAPAGRYYIGDLCYALSDDVYDKIFGLYDYESGLYSHNNGKHFFLVDGTAFGDGCYPGSDGKEFSVDAGIIGICSAALAEKDGNGGHFYTFDSDVRCSFKNGRFTFNWDNYKSLVIDTTGDDDAY